VTGAAGQLGAVGRTVTGLLLDRGLPVRAMVLDIPHQDWERALKQAGVPDHLALHLLAMASYTGRVAMTAWRMASSA
jgi:hypothetical protein